jgi:phosphate binding protein
VKNRNMRAVNKIIASWKLLAILLIALIAVGTVGCTTETTTQATPTQAAAAGQPEPTQAAQPTAASVEPTQAAQPTATAKPQPTATKAPAKQEKITGNLSGTIEIDGSSTVFPITEAVAEEFRKLYPKVQINVGVSGTGGGFKRFGAGETDISDASRPIKQAEADETTKNGIDYIELKIAIDGLSVLVNPSNDFVDCLTTAELKAIWNPDSKINNWKDVRPRFPDRKLRLYGPGTDSGTFDYFTEVINGTARASRSDYTASEDDNVLVQGINGDKDALGYFGYAYYVENPGKLKLVAVDSGNGCVAPSEKTIEAGEYKPLSRPLFIYIKTASLQRPEVKAFVEFYMLNGAQLSHEVGYIALKPAEYDMGLAAVNAGIPTAKPVAKAETQAQPTATPKPAEPTATPKPAEPTATPKPAEPTATPKPAPTATPTPEPKVELSGSIEIDGSSTVFPITEAVAEEFRKLHPKVRINVGISGTGGGFKRFGAGETDISDASRPIKKAEIDAATASGVEFIEMKIAIDGLSVLVNHDNTFVKCLTVAELKAIWAPSSTINNWKDVRPGFPDQKLRLYGPGTDSGTFDYFTEFIVGEVRSSRADYTASEDDNVLVAGIAGDKGGLGYFGYAYYVENPGKLKLVAVDAGKGGGCVLPSEKTIEAGEYTPLSRPLFIYVKKSSLQRPEVKAFVEFYQAHGAKLSAEVGYVALKSAEYQANLAKMQ